MTIIQPCNRDDMVRQARSWLGTRFAHQGRLKATTQHKGGCDCIGLVVGVIKELGMLSPEGGGKRLCDHDRTDYSRLPDGMMLQCSLDHALQPIAMADIQLGDILLFRFDTNPQHVGFVSDYGEYDLGIIHCYLGSRKVVEHRLDESWRKRIVAAYAVKGMVN